AHRQVERRAVVGVDVGQAPDDVDRPGLQPRLGDHDRLVRVRMHRLRPRQGDVGGEVGDQEAGAQQRGHQLDPERVLDQLHEHRIELEQAEDAHVVLVRVDADVAGRRTAPLALLSRPPQPPPHVRAGRRAQHARNDREPLAPQLRLGGGGIDLGDGVSQRHAPREGQLARADKAIATAPLGRRPFFEPRRNVRCARARRLDRRDSGGRRPAPAEVCQFGHCFARTRGQQFHRAVRSVAHPAVEPQAAGLALRPPAIADALHAPADREANGDAVHARAFSTPALARARNGRPYGTMEQAGEHRIAAPRDRVWAALNDPAVLKRCIEGCEALERTGPETLTARVRARVGPVSAVFSGDIALKDLDPPNGYTLEVSAKGGAAGFAKGQARVKLAEDGAATVLAYTAEGSVGGKLAQVGQRLIDAAARKTADDFFNAFARELEEPATPDAAAAGEPGGAATPVPVPTGDVPAAQAATRGGALVWGGLAAVLVIAALVAWWLTAR